MGAKVALDTAYIPSEDIVAREIEDELIIVPLTSGIGDMEDAIFTLNETGRAIWDRLDGHCSLRDVAEELTAEYEAPAGEIERDVLGLVTELVNRKMLVEATPASADYPAA